MKARFGIIAAGIFAGCGLLLAAAAIEFPRDHGAHPEAAVEWWYYTGHLRERAGREHGFQLTFFRVREIHLAHFAWTDAAGKKFLYEEKMHLALPGIASAAEGRLEVSNEDWSAVEAGGEIRLRASGPAGRLELRLRPVKKPILHGEAGLSRKGAGRDEYSRYVSITRLEARGTLSDGKSARDLSGTVWFDHEWGPGVLPAEAAGWDWFALQLDDGSELMLYRMRRADGGATPFSSGTFVPRDGAAVPIAWKDVRLESTGTWRSPRSGARYPSGWKITVVPLDLTATVDPVLADQELLTPESTGVTYWEGACRVRGTRAGRPLAGRAYVELTGYAGRDVPGLALAPGYSIFSDWTVAESVSGWRADDAARRVRAARPTSLVSSVRRNVAASFMFR
ncbi:MAG: lipocalin family protein [Thermoanaerobaculia bacterium]